MVCDIKNDTKKKTASTPRADAKLDAQDIILAAQGLMYLNKILKRRMWEPNLLLGI